jgi:hypothetical protein
MRVHKLIKLLLTQYQIYGDCEVEMEIKTPTALDPSYRAVASKPKSVVWEETGNSDPVIRILDWKK